MTAVGTGSLQVTASYSACGSGRDDVFRHFVPAFCAAGVVLKASTKYRIRIDPADALEIEVQDETGTKIGSFPEADLSHNMFTSKVELAYEIDLRLLV